MSELTAADRVQNGIDWLEANASGWRDKIMISVFDIRNPCLCILGQTFCDNALGHSLAATGFDFAAGKIENSEQLVEYLGFEGNGFGAYLNADYSALQSEWIRRLTEMEVPIRRATETVRPERRKPILKPASE